MTVSSSKQPRPPFLGYNSHNLVVSFFVGGELLKDLLPEPLRPANEFLHLNMFKVPLALGIPPYSRTYVWADVVNYTSWDGTAGRYVIEGWSEPAAFAEIAKRMFRWPAEPGETHLHTDDRTITSTLLQDGRPMMNLTAQYNSTSSELITQMLPYLAFNEDSSGSRLWAHQIAYAGSYRPLEISEVAVHADDHPLLATLAASEVHAAVEIAAGSFALGIQTPLETA
ncbi:hypothetical protein [Roseobacter weihaiensis]|uniref:hypothetical protein n=1 Tax=Roseobacter weihaiensis TaxID=2763262 RepID=UPI001D09F993|nr:hypothetical protein [Roseobacter sp. H9]